jgi:hypothetical protein
LRLALNHQTAKLENARTVALVWLRLALNHQTAKLDIDTSPWKQGLFSYFHEGRQGSAWLRTVQVDRDF